MASASVVCGSREIHFFFTASTWYLSLIQWCPDKTKMGCCSYALRSDNFEGVGSGIVPILIVVQIPTMSPIYRDFHLLLSSAETDDELKESFILVVCADYQHNNQVFGIFATTWNDVLPTKINMAYNVFWIVDWDDQGYVYILGTQNNKNTDHRLSCLTHYL